MDQSGNNTIDRRYIELLKCRVVTKWSTLNYLVLIWKYSALVSLVSFAFLFILHGCWARCGFFLTVYLCIPHQDYTPLHFSLLYDVVLPVLWYCHVIVMWESESRAILGLRDSSNLTSDWVGKPLTNGIFTPYHQEVAVEGDMQWWALKEQAQAHTIIIPLSLTAKVWISVRKLLLCPAIHFL